VVHGDNKNFLSALIVPNWAKVRATLPQVSGEPEALVKDPAVVALFQQHIDAALANATNWEQVKRFFLRPRPFTPDGGELTVSLKLKRDVILQRHAADWDALYTEV